MVRKVTLSFLLLLLIFPSAQAFSKAVPVSEHYFVDEYVAMRDYHQKVGKLYKEDPHDKALLVFSLNLLQNDLTAFENMTPPELYFEMKVRVVAGIKAHIKSLQLAIDGKPDAMKMWRRGNDNFQWVDAFLMQRDWRIDNIPLVDAGFVPDDAVLSNEQYADRYFLIRLMNEKLGAEMVEGKQGGGGVDQAERMLDSQVKAWTATRYPQEMQSIHDQVLQALNLSKQWVDLVQAGKTADAAAKEAEVKAAYGKIDDELKNKYKIQIPEFPGRSW